MDKQQKKEYLVRYVTPTLEDKWQELETFAKNEFSFEDFKKEILDSYLEMRDWSMGAFQRLQGLCVSVMFPLKSPRNRAFDPILLG